MMEIQKYLLQICIACILISVLSSFIKNEKVNSSIKSVLALYILVITLNSIANTKYNFKDLDYANEYHSATVINTDELVIKNAAHSICNQLNNKFAQAGTDTTCKVVVINIDTGEVSSVTLQNANSNALKIAKDFLGENITVINEKEG